MLADYSERHLIWDWEACLVRRAKSCSKEKLGIDGKWLWTKNLTDKDSLEMPQKSLG